MIKTQKQIDAVKEAVRITDAIYAEIREAVVAGVTEKHIYNLILKKIEESEAETFSFEPIVATGANAAEPHHVANDTVIKEGDLVVIDMGVMYDGMASDMTRMVAVGEISDHQHEVYSIVRQALEEALYPIQAGARVSDIDLAARNLIE